THPQFHWLAPASLDPLQRSRAYCSDGWCPTRAASLRDLWFREADLDERLGHQPVLPAVRGGPRRRGGKSTVPRWHCRNPGSVPGPVSHGAGTDCGVGLMRRQSPRVECVVEECEVENEQGRGVPGVCATCSRCDHETTAYGTGD